MPYPILTLPYPFARRLRHLLSPSELQELQIAAGHHNINPLKPFELSIQNCNLRFEGNITDDRNVIETCQAYRITQGEPPVSLTNLRDSVRYSVNYFELRNMSNIALKTLNLRNQQIKVHLIAITDDCHISNDLLKTVATTTSGCECLIITWNRFDEDVTIALILEIFPRLKEFVFNYAYFGWLSDLANAKKDLIFILWSDSFEKTFSFRPEELYDFVAKQGPKFCIYLTVNTTDPAAISEVNAFIDPRFQRGDSPSDVYNFIVKINFNNMDHWHRMMLP